MNHLRLQRAQVGVDVVDRRAVDANGSKQTAVLSNPAKIGANVTLIEKDAAPRVAAFDGAVEVIPLVDPPDGRGRALRGLRDRLLLRDLLQDVEDPVQFALVGAARDDPSHVAISPQWRD